MEKTYKTLETFFKIAAAFLSSLLGALYVPVLLMVLFNLIDYFTGLAASKYRNDGKISSYKSMKGIIKKVCQWLLVIVGAGLDRLLLYASNTIGFSLPFNFMIACIVAVWICVNEIISILENMIDIGVELPPFLLPLVKLIKKQAEDKTNFKDEKEL